MKRIVYGAILIIFECFVATAFSGCNNNARVNPVSEKVKDETEEASAGARVLAEEYDLYYEMNNCNLSLYECEEGIYLGAYILSNKKIDYSIERFEEKTGKKHLIYTYHINMGDELPVNWILECTAQMKTPLIVINPPVLGQPFDRELLMKTAKSFEINVPMFVEFYPGPSGDNLPVNEYIEFYKEAKKVFSKFAPKSAFIYSVSGEDAVDDLLYYPGDGYADWVGINIYLPVLEDGSYNEDIFKSIDMVYHTFQKIKPMMITQIAVSHYTSRNHTYYTMQAAEEITKIYTKIPEKYPRIKGVIYMDFNNVELISGGIRDNFSITENETVLKAYSQAIQNEKYTANFYDSEFMRRATQIMKSPYAVKKLGESFYLPDTVYGLPKEFEPGGKISEFSVNHEKKHIVAYLRP